MQASGFFVDVPDHPRSLASGRIREQPRSADQPQRELIARYLSAAPHIMDALHVAEDVFGSGETMPVAVCTDGNWVWPSDAAFYCERYGVLPHQDLVHRIDAAGGHCEGVSGARLSEIVAWFKSVTRP